MYMSPVTCSMCVNVHTNKMNIYSLKWLDYFQKDSSYARLSLLDSRHRCENPMVCALWSLSRLLTQYAEGYKVSYTLIRFPSPASLPPSPPLTHSVYTWLPLTFSLCIENIQLLTLTHIHGITFWLLMTWHHTKLPNLFPPLHSIHAVQRLRLCVRMFSPSPYCSRKNLQYRNLAPPPWTRLRGVGVVIGIILWLPNSLTVRVFG